MKSVVLIRQFTTLKFTTILKLTARLRSSRMKDTSHGFINLKPSRRRKHILKYLAVALIALLVGFAAAQVAQQYLFPTTGTVTSVTLTVTWLNGTQVTGIPWGATDNNTEYKLDPLNITNTSNVPVTLTLATANPSLSITILSLTWNYTDTPIAPDESVIVELYQNVSASGSYTYNTVITALEA